MADAPKIQRVENFDQLYPGRFLKAGELKGKKVTLRIADVRREELHGEKGPEMKVTMLFEGTEKQLVACKTNGLCMKAMFGPTLANWIGKRIIIFPDTWNGEPCIRIWGSPDLAEEMKVEIKLARRAAQHKTMRTSANGNGKAKHAPAQHEESMPDEPTSDEPPPGALADDYPEPGTEG